MHTAQFRFDGISLFIEQDVGTHTYTLLKVISCIHFHVYLSWSWCQKFVICGIVLHQRNFTGAHFSMLKISLAEVLLCSFLQCEKLWNMELCTMVFCMFHTKYQCISLESLLCVYQTMIRYKQSKGCLVFSYFHQFLELVEEDANPWALQLCLVCHFLHCYIELVVYSVNNSQTLL